jgi:CheY-like chemotaxis protein
MLDDDHEVSARVLRSLFEHVDEAVFIADEHGRYTDANQAACRMLGYTVPELLGKTVEDLLPPSEHTRLLDVKLDGLELTIAASGREGIERAIAERPSLILMDLNLPDMTGFDATDILRTLPVTCAVPIIAITAAATKADHARASTAGFAHYLTKPVRISELERAITSTLEAAPRS